MQKYEIYSDSIRNKKRDIMQNADAFHINEIPEEDLLYLAVSDGVGSTDKAWDASKIASENTFKHFKNYDFDDKSISSRLMYSIEEANKDILNSPGKVGKHMQATLCAVIVDNQNNKIYYSYLGDSRIYLFANNDLTQLSKDQDGYQSFVDKGSPVFKHGTLASRHVISNNMGQSNPVIQVFESDFPGNSSLFICSDGFYEKLNIIEELKKLLNSNDLESSFKSLFNEVSAINEDDATAIVFRKIDDDTNDSDDLDKQPEYIKYQKIKHDLIHALENSKRQDCFNIMKIIFSQKIKIPKNDYVEIMNLWSKTEMYKSQDKELNALLIKLRNLVI